MYLALKDPVVVQTVNRVEVHIKHNGHFSSVHMFIEFFVKLLQPVFTSTSKQRIISPRRFVTNTNGNL